MPRRDRDQKQSAVRRLAEELELLFLNEVGDDRLAGVDVTGIDLSPDKKVVTVSYLPPAGQEETVAEVFDGLLPVVEERCIEVLRKRPEVRFRYDRGAQNERRVGEILEELRDGGELPPSGDDAEGSSPG